MAYDTKTGLPDALAKREILAGTRKGVDLDALGEAYLDQGWLAYALDCFEKTGNQAKLAELKAAAIEKDPFLLTRLDMVIGVSADEWARAATTARASGRHTYAVLAFERAADQNAAEAEREHLEEFCKAVAAPLISRRGKNLVASQF